MKNLANHHKWHRDNQNSLYEFNTCIGDIFNNAFTLRGSQKLYNANLGSIVLAAQDESSSIILYHSKCDTSI